MVRLDTFTPPQRKKKFFVKLNLNLPGISFYFLASIFVNIVHFSTEFSREINVIENDINRLFLNESSPDVELHFLMFKRIHT